MFLHNNWVKAGFLEKFHERVKNRKFSDLTVVPVMTWNNQRIKAHVESLLSLPGVKLVFGGKPVSEKNSVPSVYGLWEPTLISVPIDLYQKHYDLITTELFGPVTLVTEYQDSQLDNVLNIIERMDRYLTAGVVSNDPGFLNKVLGSTLNGVTYAGIKARTTGAPQNHWFGPCGDPRGAGIGTIEAIRYVWSCHREIIMDTGSVDKNIKLVQS
jgi:1-pyrroline-5-carboxylate dehydrogenase